MFEVSQSGLGSTFTVAHRMQHHCCLTTGIMHVQWGRECHEGHTAAANICACQSIQRYMVYMYKLHAPLCGS